jgi:KaiC/GvpD/RAD55 family RecA-like ATPase
VNRPRRIDVGPGLELIRAEELDVHPNPIDFDALAADRQMRAHARSLEDSSRFPRMPLPELHALAGALAPGELWMVGGRQGNGKSLFIHNFVWWLIEQEIPCVVLGTEQSDDTLAIKQACVMAGVPARTILKPDPSEQATTEWKLRHEAIAAELDRLHGEYAHLVTWATDEFIDRGSLTRWTQCAMDEGRARVVIVDHLHHMQHGEGRNDVHELTQTVHLAKSLAKRYGITVVCAAQIKRTQGDTVKAYTPPAAEDFAGASAIERTADVMFGLWRPLRNDLPVDELRALQQKAKLGHAPEDRVYQPNVMGVRLVKDRLGDAPGAQCMLEVNKGRLRTIPEKDRYVTSFNANGPRV